MKRISFAVLALLMTAQQCFAGGVALSTTRVIYDGGKKEASLTVENHNKNEEFLIQSWIDDVNGNKKTPFIITPPLFKLDPDKNNVLRIVNIEDTLPKDRESVYWINVKAIPAKSAENENKKRLTDSRSHPFEVVLSSKRFAGKQPRGHETVTFPASK